MDNPRILLWISFGLICFLLWDAWNKDYGTRPVTAPATSQSEAASNTPPLPANNEVPALSLPTQDESLAESPPVQAAARSQRIQVSTDNMELEIDLAGGNLSSVRLLGYPVRKDQPDQLITLLDGQAVDQYFLQSGLLSSDSPAPDHQATFSARQKEYQLSDGQDELKVPVIWQSGGITVEKIYTFRRGSYAIDMTQRLTTADASWTGAAYVQIKRRQLPRKRSFFDVDSYSFTGPVYYDGEKYEKLNLKDLQKRPLEDRLAGGWIASIQHHFVTAAVPPTDEQVQYRSRLQNQDVALLSAVGELKTVAAGQSANFKQTLFVGPKIQKQLKLVGPKLDKTVDYGALAIFSEPLFWLLQKIHDFVGNWGWAIVLLTVMIKLVFYKLTET
ncbi:MAG: membrane protein insertase YidC, partial [Gammaproteobacteria bacterium]|nr:membrane protein insertase YidC [Gammaproteobacteria bacterium]